MWTQSKQKIAATLGIHLIQRANNWFIMDKDINFSLLFRMRAEYRLSKWRATF